MPPFSPRIIFITGTDTGVGKTVLTALLIAHLRCSGDPAFALKLFCSGGRDDARLLAGLQDGELTLDEVNPFHFPEPLAPLVAARKHRRIIRLAQVLHHIRSIEQTPSFHLSGRSAIRPPILLLEGAGGLLVPLSARLTVLDLIVELQCEVLVVAPNKLGTINHTLLTFEALRHAGVHKLTAVLVDTRKPDLSSASNPRMLSELLAPAPLLRLPFLRPAPGTPKEFRVQAVRLEAKLCKILS